MMENLKPEKENIIKDIGNLKGKNETKKKGKTKKGTKLHCN